MEADDPIGIGVGQRPEQHAATTLKTAVAAPMPSPSVRMATIAKALVAEEQAHAVAHVAQKVFERAPAGTRRACAP